MGLRTREPAKNFAFRAGVKLNSNTFRLTRAGWARRQPLALQTARLVIEPFAGNEATALAALMNDPDIARMMATIAHPFTEGDAQKWLAARVFSHEIGAEEGLCRQGELA